MPSYFLYARKSTEEEERQVASISAQLAELHAFAKMRDLEVARVFEESQSARHPGRPVFNDMMREIERGFVQGILCWKPDRLARNAVDGGQIIYALDRDALKEIVCPGRIFRNTSDDKFMLNMEFSVSKKYVDDLSDNVRRGNRAVLSSGRVPGKVPIGYLKDLPLDRSHGRGAGRTIPDPDRFHLVRAMFDRYLAGTATLADVYRFAKDDLRLQTRGTRRFPAAPISIAGIYEVFMNPFYMGLIRFGGNVFPGDHEPMLSKQEFDRVQVLLRRRSRERPSRHSFAYRGLLQCACGRGVTAETHAKPSGLSFTYYRCSRRWKDPAVCSKPFLSERVLEARIVDVLQPLDIPERFVRLGLRRLDALERKASLAADVAREGIAKQLAAKDRELERLTTLCLRDAVSEEEFIATKTKLLAEKVELSARLTGPPPEVVVLRKVREVILVGVEAPKAFAEGGPDERRRLVAGLCEKLTITPQGLEIQLATPFRILAGQGSKPDTEREGANSLPAPQKINNDGHKVNREILAVTSFDRTAIRAGANSPSVRRSALNQKENRVLHERRWTRSSSWCTVIEEVRNACLEAPQVVDDPKRPRLRGVSR